MTTNEGFVPPTTFLGINCADDDLLEASESHPLGFFFTMTAGVYVACERRSSVTGQQQGTSISLGYFLIIVFLY